MIIFTKQEKCILCVVLGVSLAGSAIQSILHVKPHLKDAFRIIDRKKSYFQVDINTASVEELVKVPYIGEFTAKRIVRYRKKFNGFSSLEELKKVKGIREKNYERFYSYLTINQ